MLETPTLSVDSDTGRRNQLTSGFLIMAEKELWAFIRAVDTLFGAEQARQSALDWIEEVGRMDWPAGESIPDWRRVTVEASARLGALSSGVSGPISRKHRNVSEEVRYMSAIA